jgi:hypothetical protein
MAEAGAASTRAHVVFTREHAVNPPILWPIHLRSLKLGCVMTFVRYREDQWLAVKL